MKRKEKDLLGEREVEKIVIMVYILLEPKKILI